MPRSACPVKISTRTRCVKMFSNEPWVTFAQIKANVNIQESNIRRTLNNNGVNGITAMREPRLWTPESGLRTVETKIEQFGLKKKLYGERKTLHSNMRTLSHLWNFSCFHTFTAGLKVSRRVPEGWHMRRHKSEAFDPDFLLRFSSQRPGDTSGRSVGQTIFRSIDCNCVCL